MEVKGERAAYKKCDKITLGKHTIQLELRGIILKLLTWYFEI